MTSPLQQIRPIFPAAPASTDAVRRDAMLDAALHVRFLDDPEYQARSDKTSLVRPGGMVDYHFAVDDEPHLPDDVFDRLRWGGTFVYITRNRNNLIGLANRFEDRGYAVLENGRPIYEKRLGMRLPLISPRRYLFAARKVLLIRPREITDRFTYEVRLERNPVNPREWIVIKEVPSLQRVAARLAARFPGVSRDEIERRARKFTDKIFPLFLTRERAILQILERHLPASFRCRVPRVLDFEQDGRGYVRRLKMNWLRIGGPSLSQLEFARQATELLMILHEVATVIHLDLRLDNFVVTEHGVCFVDFGSSVRIGENIGANPLLATIFGELMRTSEIQRMLTKMKQSGSVTSHIINAAHHKVDKAVDLFYLAVQISLPTANPEFRDLIKFDPSSEESRRIKVLSDEILRPKDPANPPYRSAKDVLHGIERIAREIA